MDGGAWWAAVHGVAKSQTRLSTHTENYSTLKMKEENHQLPHTENTISLKEKENLSTAVLRRTTQLQDRREARGILRRDCVS